MNKKRIMGWGLALALLTPHLGLAQSVAAPEPGYGYSDAPYMEAGALLVGQMSADYRSSNEVSPRLLPLPYFLYRGPIIKADRGGVRGEFWKAERWQFNVSVDGSLGSNTSDNKLRRGMDELESAVEFGPSLDVQLSGASLDDGWSVRVPVRGVFTMGKSGVHHIGYLLNPRLTWRKPIEYSPWRMSFHAGILYADRQYHDYYYGVGLRDVTSERPYYKAKGGYSGSYLKLNFFRPWHTWRFGVSLRYDNLAGAEFDNSPLYQSQHYGSLSFVVIKQLWRNRDD